MILDGQNGFSYNLTNDQWITLGQALRPVHEFDMPLLINDQIKREVYSPKWRDAVWVIYGYISAQALFLYKYLL